jgi:hypothetical protein
LGPDAIFGSDVASCTSGCESAGNSANSCYDGCNYSAGCTTWVSCLEACSGAGDDDSAG